MDTLLQGLGAGRFHRRQSIGLHGCQDVHHLPIAIVGELELATYLLHRCRQHPFLEGRAVAQGAWLARQHRHIVPGVVNRLAAFDAGELGFFGTLAGLAQPAAFTQRIDELRRTDWVVYAKRPFGSPAQVLTYLGRYTHRVAIANRRLVSLADGRVSFRWRDYRHHDKRKLMTLDVFEFIRRFLLHTLPDGFHRLRHCGFLANGHRRAKLALCRERLAAPPPATPPPTDYRERYRQLTGFSLDLCPCCGGAMLPLGALLHPDRQITPGRFDTS